MRRKRFSINQLSAETRRRAQSEAALLQAEIRKLRGGLSNIDALGSHPTVRGKRTYTKKTRENYWDDLGLSKTGFGLSFSASHRETRTIMEELIGGYESGGQAAARATEAYSLGQRLR